MMAKKKAETTPLETRWTTSDPYNKQQSKPQGIKLIDTLSGLKGMNRELAERIVSEWCEGENDVEVAARFDLDVLDAAEVIKVMEAK